MDDKVGDMIGELALVKEVNVSEIICNVPS